MKPQPQITTTLQTLGIKNKQNQQNESQRDVTQPTQINQEKANEIIVETKITEGEEIIIEADTSPKHFNELSNVESINLISTNVDQQSFAEKASHDVVKVVSDHETIKEAPQLIELTANDLKSMEQFFESRLKEVYKETSEEELRRQKIVADQEKRRQEEEHRLEEIKILSENSMFGKTIGKLIDTSNYEEEYAKRSIQIRWDLEQELKKIFLGKKKGFQQLFFEPIIEKAIQEWKRLNK